MRKFTALSVLLIIAAFWSGCGHNPTSNINLNANTADKAEQIIREHKQNGNAGAANTNAPRK